MNDIRDVKPPVYLPDFWWLLWLALGLIAAAAAVYFFLRYKKSHRVSAAPAAPELPAWEKAYQQLKALRRENLLEKGLFKEFFTRVADIARHYMENRFNIRAPHMTTDEFLYYLGITGYLNETQKSSLKDFLNSCDMVKFAKYAPTINEASKNFDLAKKLVDDTRI
jgi:UDP-N-acetylglucosamine 2-epimerase